MSGSAPPLTPSARLDAADRARRRGVVRSVAGAFSVLSVLAAVQMPLIGGANAWTMGVNFAAALCTLAAYWLSRQERHTNVAAAVLMASMLGQEVGSALTLTDLGEIRATVMFVGLLPLLAAATMRLRGTVLATLASIVSVVLVFAVGVLWINVSAAVMGQTLGAPLFFLLVAGVIAVVTAREGARSLLIQTAQERATSLAEAAAAAAETRFRVIADQVSDLVAVLDGKGNYTFASASYRRILNLAPEALIGNATPELIHPGDKESVERAFGEALQKQSRELVTRLRTADGGYNTFHLRLVGVDVDGVPQVAVTARDITTLQSLTAEIESARRMDALGRLAGGVAHDFNNLLAVIGSCSTMITAKLPADHRAQRDLKIIDDAVQQAAAVTGQLLAFARRQVLPRGRTVPSAAIANMAPLLQHALGPTVSLEVDAAGSNWMTAMSAGQIEQVIMNLVLNARDAMPQGGVVQIRVLDRRVDADEIPNLAADEYVIIEVSDTGIGMTPEVSARIFEPFFTTKGPGRGTGLGLATSFGIARQLGGTLSVESTVGEGSTFRLYLPRSTEPSAPTLEPVPMARAREGLRVLVLDDEQRICDLVARLLEMAGHQAVTASTSEAALAKANEENFDAILTDVVLGREDGLDVLAHLRQLQPQASAVVMSGFSPSPERLAALREQGVGFLPKPFSVESLIGAIARQRTRSGLTTLPPGS